MDTRAVRVISSPTMLRSLVLGAGVFVVELVLAAAGSDPGWLPLRIAVAAALAAAVVIARVEPLAGVAVVTGVEVTGVVSGIPIAADELAIALVVFQCARRGGPLTLWISGLLVPAAYLLSGAFLANAGTEAAQRVDRSGLTDDPVAVGLLLLTIASPLALPWLLGLSLRWRARAERARHALVIAQAEAEAKEQKAQLARDVHDVVGHSLVVILRQADSVRFLEADTSPAVLSVLDDIAASARASLTEVRSVLSRGRATAPPRDLDDLMARIPPSVATVHDRVIGEPRPLSSSAASVAHRVLQEMLTNALKHGEDAEIEVLRDWRDGLRLTVSNRSDRPEPGEGMGLSGMRQRLLTVDGALEARHEDGHFIAQAHIPLPHGGAAEIPAPTNGSRDA